MVNFKDLRNKRELTQAQLAEMVNVSENTIQNWESGKTRPKGDNLNQYLKALGIKDQAEMARVIGEIAAAAYGDDSEIVDNIPYFLFPEDSDIIEKIKGCSATAEELDMVGYEDYVSKRGSYARAERRTEGDHILEFAFFEKYGGFNATMKRLKEIKSRLGKLKLDALSFAYNNPNCAHLIKK